MDVWGALQYVGTGLSLVAFVVAAILLAYRARLTQRAEIIKSAPEQERLEAIATTAEFFRVDVSGLTRAQQQDIALTQIHARARRDLLLAGESLAVAILLAAIAVAAIWASKPAGPATVVNPSGPVIAPARDANFNAPVTFGLDEKQVAQRVAEAQKPLDDKLEKILALTAHEKGVDVAPLRAILVKMGEAGVRDDDIPKRLDEKADELIRFRAEIDRLRQGPASLVSFAQQARTLIDKGDLDGARAALAAGRAAARTSREQSSRVEADFLAQEAKVDHLQFAYRRAAEKYAEAASLLAALDRQKQWEFVLAQAHELYSQGDEFGDNTALVEAINVHRNSLLLAPRTQRPLDWAQTQNKLGSALATLGEREDDTARLEEAVVAYRDALKERTRARAPLQWAETQTSLSAVLWALGERESGTARLEEAVVASRDALMEITRERVPLEWARTQNNLGNALWTLGVRNNDAARLEEAVVAYRDALKEWTRERATLAWGRTQTNLGNALATLGERESGTARLEEAVAAYRAALQEVTPVRTRLAWATAQINLGNALQTLGIRNNDAVRLEEAVAAYRDALTEYTRERAPLQWAMAHHNLGMALATLGVRNNDAARLEEAVTAYRNALKVRTRAPSDWAMTQQFLGDVALMLGARDTAWLEEAVAAYRDALKEFTRERVPFQWAQSFGNQGVALMHLAERTKDAMMAEMALRQIETALETMRAVGHAPNAAYYQASLSEARRIRDALKVP